MQDPKAYNKILKARTSLVLNHPFFASLALRLKVREDYNCQTVWTDGNVFAYNPHYINILPAKKLEGLAAHVVMHPACNHHKRRQGRDKKMWNRACDYAINGILLDAGIILPDGHLHHDQYMDKSAENIYEILCSGGDDENDDPDESSQEVKEEDNQNQENPEEGEDNQAAGKDEGEDEDDQDTTGSDGDPGLSGEVRDEPEGSAMGEGEATETDWDEALVQAAHNAREIGKLPGALERLIEKKINPRLGWQELLSRFIERSARSDYSWVTPNRRYIYQNLYLPSLKNSELCEVVVAIDTSGSIKDTELSQFAAEISEIMEQYPATIHLIYCDLKIVRHETFQRSDLPITINPKGGGGTDYRPVFERVSRSIMNPACLIYMTDMECLGFPEREPSYPVMWVKTGGSKREPPFGEVLVLAST